VRKLLSARPTFTHAGIPGECDHSVLYLGLLFVFLRWSVSRAHSRVYERLVGKRAKIGSPHLQSAMARKESGDRKTRRKNNDRFQDASSKNCALHQFVRKLLQHSQLSEPPEPPEPPERRQYFEYRQRWEHFEYWWPRAVPGQAAALMAQAIRRKRASDGGPSSTRSSCARSLRQSSVGKKSMRP
jgi:hypothetical protein